MVVKQSFNPLYLRCAKLTLLGLCALSFSFLPISCQPLTCAGRSEGMQWGRILYRDDKGEAGEVLWPHSNSVLQWFCSTRRRRYTQMGRRWQCIGYTSKASEDDVR